VEIGAEYKKIPVSTKNGNTNKIIFTSPQQQTSKLQTGSKKGSPDPTAFAINDKQNDQQTNLKNFLQRRTSEEKLNMNLGGVKAGGGTAAGSS
jgi:hypothetical protein